MMMSLMTSSYSLLPLRSEAPFRLMRRNFQNLRSVNLRHNASNDVTHDPHHRGQHNKQAHKDQQAGEPITESEREAASHRLKQKARFMNMDLNRWNHLSPYQHHPSAAAAGSSAAASSAGGQDDSTSSFRADAMRDRLRHLPFSSIAASSLEMKAMMTLTCTEFGHTGEVKSSAVKYLKSDLSALHGLETRDLRTLDSFRSQVPTILVRKSAIVVNLEHVKAIIKPDEFVLFDTVESDNYHQSLFVFDLQERLRVNSADPGTLPYELRAFEAILVSVTTVFRDQLQKLSPKVHSLLRRLETDSRVDRDTLLDVLDFSKKLNKFDSRVANVRQAITELLNSDSDMADMYLTARKETGAARPAHLHQEVEFMLEFYTKQLEEVGSQCSQLISNIRTTQDITQITLNTQRNALLILEIRLVMATLGVTSGTLIAGLFGMNLKSGWEAHPLAFYITSSTILVASVGIISFFLRKLRRVIHTE